jgi:hypothetical protein
LIRLHVGGVIYYITEPAWERLDDGTWVMLTQAQMAQAVELWVRSDSYLHVARGGADVSVIHTRAIEHYEVIDNSYFRASTDR